MPQTPRLVSVLIIILSTLSIFPVASRTATAAALYSAYGIRQGDQRIGVVILDLDWSPDPNMVDRAQDILEGEDRTPYSVQHYFDAISNNAIHFDFDVFGPYTVDAPWCRHGAIVAAGSNAFIQSGGDPARYDAMMYVTEEAPSGDCQSQDDAYHGDYRADTRTIVLFGHLEASLIIHELGHELGLEHAHSYVCSNASQTADTCAIDEYGDPTDLMGHPWPTNIYYSFNAPHRIAMGLIAENQLKTVRHSGDYTVLGSGAAKDGTHILSIRIPGGPLGAETYLYVEYRQPLAAFRRVMPSSVVVTAWTNGGGQPTYYLGRLSCRATACDSLSVTQGTVSVTLILLHEGTQQAKVQVDIQSATNELGETLLVSQA